MSYVLPGLVLFAVGFILLFGLLASQSALAKSKQLSALGHVLGGGAGAGKKGLAILALVLLGLGTCASLAGVASKDRAACTNYCTKLGYKRALLRDSTERDAKDPKRAAFRACACEDGPDPDPHEIVATKVPTE
jgi:hypothetical protein